MPTANLSLDFGDGLTDGTLDELGLVEVAFLLFERGVFTAYFLAVVEKSPHRKSGICVHQYGSIYKYSFFWHLQDAIYNPSFRYIRPLTS